MDGRYRGGGVAENEILRLAGCYAEEADDLKNFKPERTIQYVKSRAMNSSRLEPLPLHIIPFANHFLYLKDTHIDGEGVLSRIIGSMQTEDLSGRWFYTNLIPHKHDPGAKYPKWLEFLLEVVKPEDVPFLQELCGYCLYRGYPAKLLTIFIGGGNNGKSIFLKTLIHVLGEDNVSNVTLADITYNRFKVAQLQGKLADISADIGSNEIKYTGTIKAVTGGDRVNGENKHGRPFDFTAYSKIIYSANEPPIIKDETDSIKNRLRVVEFPYTFSFNPKPGEKQAKNEEVLLSELRDEEAGILNWMLEGLNRLMANNFCISYSKSTEETWTFYQLCANPITPWLESCLLYTGNPEDRNSNESLYAHFVEWAKAKGVKRVPGKYKFYEYLRLAGLHGKQYRDDKDSRCYGLVGYQLSDCHSFQRTLPTEKTKPVIQGLMCPQSCDKMTELGEGVPVTPKDPALEGLFHTFMELDQRNPGGVPRNLLWKELLIYAGQHDITESYVKDALAQWKEDGVIFCPQDGLVKKA